MKNNLKTSKAARVISDCQFINETFGNGEFPEVLYKLCDTLTNKEYKYLTPMVKEILISEAWDVIKDSLTTSPFKKLSEGCAWIADNTANNPLWYDKEYSKQLVNDFHTIITKEIDKVDIAQSKQYQPFIVSLFTTLSSMFAMMEEDFKNKK